MTPEDCRTTAEPRRRSMLMLGCVALADPHYVQQDLYPGEITVASIWGLLPTPNELVQVELTGVQLIEVIESRRPLVAGLAAGNDHSMSSGQPIDLDAVYRVLVSDSLYAGGKGFKLYLQDPEPTYLGLDWRLPPIEWIRSLGTTRSAPLRISASN